MKKKRILFLLAVIPMAAVIIIMGYFLGWNPKLVTVLQLTFLTIQLTAFFIYTRYILKEFKVRKAELQDLLKRLKGDNATNN